MRSALFLVLFTVAAPACSSMPASERARETIAQARTVACTACRGLAAAEQGDLVEALQVATGRLEAVAHALEQLTEVTESLRQVVQVATRWPGPLDPYPPDAGPQARPEPSEPPGGVTMPDDPANAPQTPPEPPGGPVEPSADGDQGP